MIGFEIVGVLLGLYPIAIHAIDVYKDTKSGRAAASLRRKLKTEAMIYKQFARKLLSPTLSADEINLLLAQETPDIDRWKSVGIDQQLRDRLDPELTTHILEMLQEIDEILRALKTELSSISRGLEVLEKLRSSFKVANYTKPQSGFQQRLSQLTTLNADLNRLVGDHPLKFTKRPEVGPKATKFLVRNYQEAIQLYEFIRCEGYDCDCDKPHVTNFGLNCPAHSTQAALTDLESYKWDFELMLPTVKYEDKTVSSMTNIAENEEVFDDILSEEEETSQSRKEAGEESLQPAKKRERSRSISITELTGIPQDQRSVFRDICSFIHKISSDSPEPDNYLGIVGKTNRKYKLCIKPEHENVSMDIISLEELMKPSCTRLRKDRMELALRLCCSILQFYYTGWIDNDWAPKDFCVLSFKNEQSDELPQLFVTRKFYSARISANLDSQTEAVNKLWSRYYDEPILTKLGFALIELAFCRKLSEIRKERLHDNSDEEHPELLNMQTAMAMLDSGLLAREESQVYESVVRACIKHQYPSLSSSGPKGLDSKDDSFFERAEESIIAPLRAEFVKTWG